MGLKINLVFDANAEAAPETFRDAVQIAADELEAAIDDPITVNVEVGYGEYDLGGPDYTPLISDFSLGGIINSIPVSYPLLVGALAANETTTADTEAINSLPAALTLNGQSNFFISTAEAKALGVISPTDQAIDGYIGFPTSFTSQDVTDTAIVELAHALGLLNGGGVETLVEYISPGSHLLTGETTKRAAYFSIDGGNTNLANFDVRFDSTLFENLPNDPFNVPSPGGTLTSLDLDMLSILGFDVISTPLLPTPTITPTESAAGSAPVVVVQNVTVAENAAIPVADLIKSVSVAAGDSIASYTFEDQGSGDGHFSIDGLIEPDNQWIEVLSTQLDTFEYVGGSTPGTSEQLDVSAYDATSNTYSAVADLTATTTATTSPTFEPPTLVLSSFGASPSAGGWGDQATYPVELGDVTGNGMDDIVGFGAAGVYVSLATGGGNFAQPTLALSALGANAGWGNQNKFPIELGDVTGNGRDDVVAFGSSGVYTALSNGDGTFAQPTLALSAFDANTGWGNQATYPVELGDVTGNGRDDIVGFGASGVYVALANGNGTFSQPTLALSALGADAGWGNQNQFPIELGDVTGNGLDDIVAIGSAGVYVALANGDGTFSQPTLALNAFGADAGWGNQNLYPIELADVTGNGRDDIVAFGSAGVYVALANGNGTFSQPTLALSAFGANGGWTSQNMSPRLLGDVTGSGRADILGFGQGGVFEALASAMPMA